MKNDTFVSKQDEENNCSLKPGVGAWQWLSLVESNLCGRISVFIVHEWSNVHDYHDYRLPR